MIVHHVKNETRIQMDVFLTCEQGRHHGSESGGDKICERSEQKNFFDPPTFGACGGYKKIGWHFTLQSKIGILERTYKKCYVFNQ